jgi:hypothetical protein
MSSAYFPLLAGALILGTAYQIGSIRPYDWLTTPAQKLSEAPGNMDFNINYPQSIYYFHNAEDPNRFINSKYYQQKPGRLNGTMSTHPQERKNAVESIVRYNNRMSSNNWGLSSPYTTSN